MKTYQQVRDVIEHTRSFHRQLSDYYQALEEKADKQRVKLFLNYLSGHEQNLENALANYEGEVSKDILDDYLQYLPAKDDERTDELAIEETAIERDMSVADVVSLALKYDDYLINLYQDLSERADQPKVKEHFRNLLLLETEARHQMARGAVEAEDF
jgi:hypothetical protein